MLKTLACIVAFTALSSLAAVLPKRNAAFLTAVKNGNNATPAIYGTNWKWTKYANCSSPWVHKDTVYVGCGDASLHAIDSNTGTHVWSFATGNTIVAQPSADDDNVYVGSTDTNFYAVSRSDGSLVWNYSMGSGGDPYKHSRPQTYGGNVLISNTDSYLSAVNISSGQESFSATAAFSPALGEGAFYSGSTNGYIIKNLYGNNNGGGQCSFSAPDGNRIFNPVIVKPYVIAGSGDGNLYAMGLNDCNQKWTVTLPGSVHFSDAVASRDGDITEHNDGDITEHEESEYEETGKGTLIHKPKKERPKRTGFCSSDDGQLRLLHRIEGVVSATSSLDGSFIELWVGEPHDHFYKPEESSSTSRSYSDFVAICQFGPHPFSVQLCGCHPAVQTEWFYFCNSDGSTSWPLSNSGNIEALHPLLLLATAEMFCRDQIH